MALELDFKSSCDLLYFLVLWSTAVVRRYRRKREGLRGSGLERAPLLPSSSPFLRITAQYDRDDDSADRTFTMPPPRTGRRRFDPLTVNPV